MYSNPFIYFYKKKKENKSLKTLIFEWKKEAKCLSIVSFIYN